MTIALDVARFEREGFGVVRGVVARERLAALRAEWDAFHQTDATERPNLVPNDQPVATFWRHVPGERKRTRPLGEFPALQAMALDRGLAGLVRQVVSGRGAAEVDLRLFEIIVFNKPPRLGSAFSWHQDISYFPFSPTNQLSLWIPFERVDNQNGTVRFALGSHRLGAVRSIEVQSGRSFPGDDRPPIPSDPAAAGLEVVAIQLEPGDLVMFDCATWHCSTPNESDGPRRSLSVRYLVGPTRFAPTPGSAGTFLEQITVRPGELIGGPAFPPV